MSLKRLLAWSAWCSAALFAVACISNAASRCEPGAQTVCACPDGSPGVHTCRSNGEGYNACEGCAANGPDACGPLDTLENCGACGVACQPAHVKGASCETGSCKYAECFGSFADCDEDRANGCETDTHGDSDNCGACGASCKTAGFEHVTKAACLAGACDYLTCAPLYGDCDGDRTNGCERPSNTLDDCGACGVPCAPEHAVAPSCVTGSCGMAACAPGYYDCDGKPANGCESGGAKNCGGCGKACKPDEGCLAGKCGPLGKSCLDVQNSGGSIGDGVYTIDPTGGSASDAFDVYCDMSSEGGGWTFVAGVVPTDGDLVDWFNTAFWQNPVEVGDFAKRFAADYKSRAASQVTAKAIMIQVAKSAAPADVIGYRGWALGGQTYNSFFNQSNNVVMTQGQIFAKVGAVYAWEPLLKFGQELIANRIENSNGDGTRLGVTSRPFNADDNQPGLGTAMNLGCCGKDHRHADVELQWNTNDNIWCSTVNGDGTYKWLGDDVGCGGSCGGCQGTAGPGYSPAWNYRIYVR